MHILIVTNIAARRLQIRSELVREGYTVALASNARSGLRALKSEKVDLVISDLYMPSMDGIVFHREAQRIAGKLPFIFISTQGDPSKITQMSELENCVVVRRESSASEMLTHFHRLTASHSHATPHSPHAAPPPLTPKPAETPHSPVNSSPAEHEPHGNRILLVDDDDSFRLVVGDILTSSGYTVFPASDGSDAITMLQKESYDLILLDIFMPVVSGYGVLRFIQENNIRVKVIVVTAYNDLKLAVEAKELGAADFIAKPVMREDLLKTIEQVLTTSVSQVNQ